MSSFHRELLQRLRFRGQPIPDPESVVTWGNARFTVLTPRLLRLEWSENGAFEDRGSFAFPTRYAPAPAFTIREEGRKLTLRTLCLTLRYVHSSEGFSADNLSIEIQLGNQQGTWLPGMPDTGNLRGTRRTLDLCAGDAALEPGLLSRDGWSLFDDSKSVVFDRDSGWPVPRPGDARQDWYFFGYGHDYRAALADYNRFGGPVPLIPRFVLGAWWSRYWAYSDEELKQLVREFERQDLPLDVLVVDMDWHTPHAWTGYTWNRELFPDPPAFLKWVHDKGLRVTLNLHPAQGVGAFEEVYSRFAQAMGLDPEQGEPIPFRITDRRFVQSYFELLHHPMEDDGVDFWWVDWQQGEATEMPGLDPLPWLNHLHHSDSRRRGRRPMLYSRWGGLGNHRYPIGFSGDTWVSWQALQFQPFFTATAANVLFGWWSHDIGGHMGDPTEPELFARWVQFGAVSPVLRLHATKDPRSERRPWKYPPEVYEAAKSAFHLRYQLVHYLYTLARVHTDTGVSPCRPMYYAYPEEEAAYAARYQYLLGDWMLVAPIVHPLSKETGLASTDVWIPDGTWIDIQTKESFTGPRWLRLLGGLERLPILVKSGSVLPLAPAFGEASTPTMASGTTDSLRNDRLVLSVFPGDRGSFRLYEDDGITEAYQQGHYTWTEFTSQMVNPGRWEVQIGAAEGHCPSLPAQRSYQVRLEASHRPHQVTIDGRESSDWSYDPKTLTTVIEVPVSDRKQPASVLAVADGSLSALGPQRNLGLVQRDVQHLLGARNAAGLGREELLTAAQAASGRARADAIARLGGPFVRFIEHSTPEETRERLGLLIVGGPDNRSEPYDLSVAFRRLGSEGAPLAVVERKGVTGDHLVDVPFAFTGHLGSFQWFAEVELSWRREILHSSYASRPYFPSIHVWRVLVREEPPGTLPLTVVLAAGGKPDPHLAWKPYVQDIESMASLQESYFIRLGAEYAPALRSGAPLAAYLATVVECPGARPAILQFRAPGPVDVALNGDPLHQQPVREEDETIQPLFREPRRTAPMELQAGPNLLLVRSRPEQDGSGRWFFEGSMITPGGGEMVDLVYRLPNDAQRR